MTAIKTSRLLIKPWTQDDLEDACKLWGDPKVMAFIDTRGGLNREQVAEKLNQEIQRQIEYQVQYWKVTLQSSSEVVGCCGLRPYDLKNKVYEIGFHIMSRHWGNGYAKEAAKAVIDYAFNDLKVAKLFAGHNPRNETSQMLLTKLGFHYIGDQFYEPTGLNHPSYELSHHKKPSEQIWAL